jgi:hypothetical protein
MLNFAKWKLELDAKTIDGRSAMPNDVALDTHYCASAV